MDFQNLSSDDGPSGCNLHYLIWVFQYKVRHSIFMLKLITDLEIDNMVIGNW